MLFRNEMMSLFSHEKSVSSRVVWRVLGGAFALGLVIIVYLNRAEIRLIASQFSVYWAIASNRPLIIALLVKILLTAFVFAMLGGAGCLLFSAFQFTAARREQQQENERFAEATSFERALPPSFPLESAPQGAGRTAEGRDAELRTVLSVEPHALPSPRILLPITPIPAVLTKEPAVPPIAPVQDVPQELPFPRAGEAIEPEEEIDEEDTPHEESPDASVYIEITLLKRITMTLVVPSTGKRYPIGTEGFTVKTLQLIAYLAWRQGKEVRLVTMRDHIFGSDESDENQAQMSFASAKRDIRRRIDLTVAKVNKDAGQQVLPDKLDLFNLQLSRKYSLSKYCRVTDLACIEEQHAIIAHAETSHELVTSIPQSVKDASDRLIQAYTGDFLEDALQDDAEAFGGSSAWVQSWAREPFTLYRDYYLQALLYAAEYERKAGDAEISTVVQRTYYSEAARLFILGAMAACKDEKHFRGRFDTKVYFAKPGRRAGAHVILSEQMLRRGIAMCGRIGDTTLANKAYADYEQQMYAVSARSWTVDPETLKDLELARAQTGAYRFQEAVATTYALESPLVNAESA